jgi:hypothetical protein
MWSCWTSGFGAAVCGCFCGDQLRLKIGWKVPPIAALFQVVPKVVVSLLRFVGAGNTVLCDQASLSAAGSYSCGKCVHVEHRYIPLSGGGA